MRRRRGRLVDALPLVDSVEVAARHLKVGEGVRRTLAVVGYPSSVRLGWLEPVVTHTGPVDVSVHVEPVPSSVAADRLRRQLARLESTRRLDASRGRLADPEVEAAADDARALADRLARGDGKLFRLGLYATVRPPTAARPTRRWTGCGASSTRCCCRRCRPLSARWRDG